MEKIGKKDMITIGGGLNVNSIYYHANGLNAKRDPFTYFLNGNIAVNVLGISFPFTFNYSNYKGTYTKPFNMTSFNPTYKWIKGYAGITSMNFSQYTLAGHIFEGGGVEITPKNWKIAAMYGRLNKAIEYDVINQSDANMQFKRMGMGLNVGYEKNGYGIGYTIFRAKDEINSLQYIPSNTQLTPQENVVMALNGKTKVIKNMSLTAEYALSGLTRNLFAETEKPSNNAIYHSFLKNRTTTSYFSAYKAALAYTGKGYGIQLQYERVDPNYKTLGGYFFNNDLENITIAPNVTLFKNKLNISANVGKQKNNLNSEKISTSSRWVSALNLSFAPSQKWNFNVSYSNFSTFTKIRQQTDPFFRDNLDSLNFYQISQNANTTITHSFGKQLIKHTITATGAYQIANNKTNGASDGADTKVMNGNLIYSSNFTKTKTSLSFGLNYNRSHLPNLMNEFYGPTLSVSKSFFKNLIKSTLGTTYNKSLLNGKENSSVLNSRFGLTYSPKLKNEKIGKPNIGLNANYLARFKTNTTLPFEELTIMLNLGYSF
ncbi:MAG: hypothetical protein ACK504_10915 [Bacteroidota bacterium]